MLAVGGELQPTLDGPMLTLEVSDGDVSGNTGINQFSGRIENDGPFGPLVTTSLNGPHALVAQERIYLKHLEAVDGFEVDAEEGGINLVARGLIVVTLRSLGDYGVG
jgi:hypothetical protein